MNLIVYCSKYNSSLNLQITQSGYLTLKDVTHCWMGYLCSNSFFFEFVESPEPLENSTSSFDSQTEKLTYSISKGIFLQFEHQLVYRNPNLFFIVSLLFALWAVNEFFNKIRHFLVYWLCPNDFTSDNGDTFIFTEKKGYYFQSKP